MKKLLIVLPLVVLVGCASSQPTVTTPTKVEIPTVPEFDIRMMTRSEVVSAVNECENNDMKPFVEYISQKTTYGRVMVPVNVHCNPLKK
jgi:uncharacterized protein YcfL